MLEDIDHYNCSETWHRFSSLFRRHLLSDGCHYVAEDAGAYWLFDAICSYHSKVMTLARKDRRLAEMQIWKLVVKGNKCVLTCWADTGDGDKAVITQRIPYTDFPEGEWKFYVEPSSAYPDHWAIMLPAEH